MFTDKDMNARLGDFGLARMHDHGQVANTTRVVGTVGYLAPENSDVDEYEAEDMDVYLLESLRSNTMLSNFSLSLSHGSHPTFEEIREGLSSSMSISWTNSLVDGR
ncbi:hypothetical protein HAX54_023037 [Datura stramonium]|uniref:Protein kinase domain-containing protein n=1 Tax=Datura stramonium TaxID=4076 RepID=A0ABS8UVP0_DATST|nr:hypothetical protein [Datura stramonium]